MDFVEPPFRPRPHILEFLLHKQIKRPPPCPTRANSTNAMSPSQPWSLRAFFTGDEVIDVTPERKKAVGLYIDVF